MTKIAKYLLATFALIGAVDFLGFVAWGLSGQFPPDDFFIGTITWHLIHDFWSVYPYLLVAWIFLAPIVCAYVAWHYAQREVRRAQRRIVNDAQQVFDTLSRTDVVLSNSVLDIYSKIEDAPTPKKTKVRKLRVKSRK